MDDKLKTKVDYVLRSVDRPTNLEEFLEAKRLFRKAQRELPFEEKIRRVIEMQKIERDFKRDKSKHIYVRH